MKWPVFSATLSILGAASSAWAGTTHVDFDDGTTGNLTSSGDVTVASGEALLGSGGAQLVVPFFPLTAGEAFQAEFTVHNLGDLLARTDFAFGWECGFYAGAMLKTSGTNFIARVGTFDHLWVNDPGACADRGEAVGSPGADIATIRIVVDPGANTTECYVGYGDDATSPGSPGNLHLVDTFPWGTWGTGTGLRIVNWAGSLRIGNVTIQGGSSVPDYQSPDVEPVDPADIAGAGEWRVQDVVAGTAFLAPDPSGDVQGHDLTLVQQRTGGSPTWTYTCTVSDTSATDRAVTLALVMPFDARGWRWWDDAERSRVIAGTALFRNTTDDYYGAALMASRYPVAVLDNGSQALCLAVPVDPGRAVRFQYDPVNLQLRAEFDFGLSTIPEAFPSKAGATVLAYTVPAQWPFRQALNTYYDLHRDILRRRAGEGGTLLRGSALEGIENPEDFFFTWHDFAAEYSSVYDWSQIDEAQGVDSFLYREPQTQWRTLRGPLSAEAHTDFDDGTTGGLTTDGAVTVSSGAAHIAPGAALVVPGFPTAIHEDLEAEFTLHNISSLSSLSAFDLGWQGRFWCGFRKNASTGSVAKVGAFDFASAGYANGETVAGQATSTVTVKLVTRRAENITRVYAAYDDDARDGAAAPNLHLVGYFPMGSWTASAGFPLYIRNYASVPIVVDDVVVTRFSGADPPLNYESCFAQLQEDANRGDAEAQATIVGGAFDADGRYNLYLGDIVWTTAFPFGVNTAPGVRNTGFPAWPDKATFEHGVLGPLLGWDGTPSLMEGMYFDSMQGWGNVRNYRQEHWKTTAYPLTFDRYNGNAVCLLNIWGNVAYANAVAGTLHQNGQLLAGNDSYFQIWYHMPSIDIPGREINNYVNGVWSPPSDETYLYFRSNAYQRPFWTLMNDNYDDGSHMEEYFQRSLFYGIFPSMYHAHDGASAWYWGTPAYYNRDRSLFLKYIPLIRELDSAGWEPVPYATVAPGTVRIERFGNGTGGNLAYTFHNTTEDPVMAALTVSHEPLGIAAVVSATESIGGEAVVSVGGDGASTAFELPLAAHGFAMLRIETPAIEAAFETDSATVGEGAGTVDIPVALSGPAAEGNGAFVHIQAQAGTATAGEDYALEDTVVTFEPGATRGVCTVTIVNDDAAEAPESFLLVLSDPLGCTLGSLGIQHAVTIIDDGIDSDGDSLSDADEILVYGTDPLQTDTDGDGVSDFNEVVFGTDPLDSSDVPSLSSIRAPLFSERNDTCRPFPLSGSRE